MASRAPSVSAVLPTLNAERHLEACLASLRAQDYPGELEVVLVDGGSSDRTLAIAGAYGVERVLQNPLRTGEAGKAIGVKAAAGELILLVDSDNALVGSDWLARMVAPLLADETVLGCEPARFAYVPGDHYINRWHALLGTADPLTLYLGNYARESVLTGRWTGLPVESAARAGWERIVLSPGAVPTLGANGFLLRRSAAELVPLGDQLFDIDLVHDLVAAGHRTFARVDVAVHHAFCESAAQYAAKTRRRVDDFFFFATQGRRSYPWTAGRRRGVVRFALATLLVVPVLAAALRGQRRAPDLRAWAWHPLACWITLLTYAAGTLRGRLRPRLADRSRWRQ